MKLNNFRINHPCIYTLIQHLLVYPFYVGVFALYVYLVPVYQNAMYGTYWRVTTEGLIPGLCMVSALPWLITTVIKVIASSRPYSKYGIFVSNFSRFIIDGIFYLSIAILYDVLNGGFLLPSHLALLTLMLPQYIILTIIYIVRIRRIKKVSFKY